MKSNPLGAIFSADTQFPNQKYATSVLESMSTLETTQNIFLKQNNQYVNQTLVTNQFRNILNSIYNSSNPFPAMDLINNLNKYAISNNQDLNQYNSPYTFLYYLLLIFEQEYNEVFQLQINLNQEFPDLQNAAGFLNQLYGLPNTSIILKNYFFSLIMSNICNSCKSTKVKPVIKKTIDLNIDSYKQLNNGNPLSLNDCLNYYFSVKNIQAICQNCHQSSFFQSRMIQKSGPVLIINLMRNNYTGEKDPNFTIDLNLDISNYKQDKTDGNNYYTLKSCISFSNYGFFSDCYVKRDNMVGAWYRYMDKQQIPSNQNNLFDFQPILLFYEASNNQNNINNMNVNIGQNMNYNNQNDTQNVNINQNININEQNNKINENIFDIISNFPINIQIAIENEFHNFDFNLDMSDNNQQSNFQMNNNFDNNQNQINNNFYKVPSQEQNQFNQINQNNNEMNMNVNMNNQNLNNNNFNQNIEQINQNNEQNTDDNESKNKNLDNEIGENSLNPFFVAHNNNGQNMNDNLGNNNENINFNVPNNLNQNQNNEINKNLNQDLNNDMNSELNKNIIPGLNNININDNPFYNPNNFPNTNDMHQNQPNIISQNQNFQFNLQDNKQIPQNNNLNEQINNEMFNNFQQDKNIIPNNNENMSLNKQENKQMQPDIQQNNFMQNNNIQNAMNNNMNIQEEKKLEMPQMPNINNEQNQITNNFIPQMNIPFQHIQNPNHENKNIINNEISQQKIPSVNMPINQNFNNINQMPQFNIPQNIPIKVKEEKVKKEEPKLIKKEMPKPEPKKEIKKEMAKPEPKKEIKKEEKKKEETKPNKGVERKISMQERIKMMAGGIKLNQPPQAAAPKKRFSQDTLPKNEPKKEEIKQKPMQFGGGKSNQMNQFKAMLEKKGGFGAPRPSAQMMGMPHGFGMMMNNNDKGGQEPKHDKGDELEDTLNKINIQKKKKKSKIVFNEDNQ